MFGRPRTVDAIVASFQKTIDELKTVSAACDTRCNKLQEEIQNKKDEVWSNAQESQRATRIAQKLEEVLK